MDFLEKEISIPKASAKTNWLLHLGQRILSHIEDGLLAIRVSVSDSSGADYKFEVDVLNGSQCD